MFCITHIAFSAFASISPFATMVYCTKQEEIYQESQRSNVATGNAGWPSQTQTQTQRCGALSAHCNQKESKEIKKNKERKIKVVTRPKYPPYSETQYPCRTVFSVVSQTIAAIPPLLSVEVAYRNPKTGLTRRVSQKKLAPEAYGAIGGVARNSIANRAIVGH